MRCWKLISMMIVLFPTILLGQQRHGDLRDMPDHRGINRDHDGRYLRKNYNIYMKGRFIEMLEMDYDNVGTPGADYARIYVTDNGGTTSLAMVDSNGIQTIFGTGGGGATVLTDLTDVNVTSPSNAEVLTYNSGTAVWQSQVASGGGHGNGANCSSGLYPLGVDANGVVESCTDATTEIQSEIAAHSSTSGAHHTQTTSGDIDHDSITGVSIDDHHARDHDIDGSTHTGKLTATKVQYLEDVTSSVQNQLDNHNHSGSDITSGFVALSQGGMGQNVSGFNGLLKISGGTSSQIIAVGDNELSYSTDNSGSTVSIHDFISSAPSSGDGARYNPTGTGGWEPYTWGAGGGGGGHGNGANCNTGEYPLGVDADGATESCTDATTEIQSEIAAHSATAGAHQKTVYVKVMAYSDSPATGDGVAYITVPPVLNGMNLVDADVTLYTIQSTGTPTWQLHNDTDMVDMLTTEMTIDASETNSYTASTQPVIDTSNDDVVTGDILRMDCDQAVSGTKGTDIILTFGLP